MKNQSENKNSGIQYDAFISYRHVKTDSMVAEALHKKLEHYHIPKKIQRETGKKKIRRIFRDREELPLSSNLTDTIYEALDHSEFLIVICSPEALASEWVQREVEYFVSHHGRDKVLTVLVRGEPEESFPSLLCEKAEPLAADVRGGSEKEILKKLDSEFLRLAAAMLGCNYDDLKQRHREYRMRRMVTGMGMGMALAILFSMYAIYQNMRIQEQYQETRKNQARYLVQEANKLMDEGDRYGSLMTSLAITPENGSENGPVVPEQMYALNRALYSYYHSGSYCSFQPVISVNLDGTTTDVNAFSPQGDVFFSLDSEGRASFFDTSNTELIWKTKVSDFADQEDSVFVDGYFLTNDRIVLMTDHYFYILDIRNQCCIRTIESKSKSTYWSGNPVAIYEHSFAVSYPYDTCVYIYDGSDSGRDAPLMFELDMDVYEEKIQVTAMEFSPDGEKLTVGIGHNTSDPLKEQLSKALFVIELNSKNIMKIGADSVSTFSYIDEDKIAVIWYKELEDMIDSNYYTRAFRAAVYSISRKRELWTSETMPDYTLWGVHNVGIDNIQEFIYENIEREITVFWIVDELLILDSETNEVLVRNNFDGIIRNVKSMNEHNLLVGLYDGSVYRHWIEGYSKMFSIGQNIYSVYYDTSESVLVQPVIDSDRLVFSGLVVDSNMIPSEGELVFPDCMKASEVVEGTESSLVASCDGHYIEITNSDEDTLLFKIAVNKINGGNPLFGFFYHDRQLIIYDESKRLQIWDIETKSKVTDQYLDGIGACKTELITDPEGEYFALRTGDGVMTADEENGFQFSELAVYQVDQNFQIYPYAVVPYGHVNFRKREIYCRSLSEDTYYAAPFYTYEELKDRAEALLGNRKLTEVERKRYYMQ